MGNRIAAATLGRISVRVPAAHGDGNYSRATHEIALTLPVSREDLEAVVHGMLTEGFTWAEFHSPSATMTAVLDVMLGEGLAGLQTYHRRLEPMRRPGSRGHADYLRVAAIVDQALGLRPSTAGRAAS